MRPLTFTSRLRRPPVSSTIPSHRIRSFHSTRPSPFVADAIAASTDFLHSVHAVTGLPWAASIPLTAVAVRMAVAFPLQIYSRVHNRRRVEMTPILYTYRKFVMESMKRTNLEARVYMRHAQAEKQIRDRLKGISKDLHRDFSIMRYSQFIPLLQLPIWLSLMEGIRNMCGVSLGLFRYMVPLPDQDGHTVDLPGVEPTLANEGALWFPDLLAGDPTGILPLVLGLSIMANVRVGGKTKTLAEASDYTTPEMTRFLVAKALQEGLSVLGIYIAFTAYMTGMPVGMLLYWIASTNTATVQSLFLDKYLFATKPIQTYPPMNIRLLKPGEKPPPVKSMLS